MAFFLLHQGSHNVGMGVDAHTFRSREPGNNVVESDEDLAYEMPEKFRPATEAEAKAANERKKLRGAKNTGPGGKKQELLDRGLKTAAASAPDAESEEEQLSEKEEGEEPEGGPQTGPSQAEEVEDDGLEAMTVPDLRKLAVKEQVEFSSATRKDELVEAIREKRRGE